MQLFKLTHKGLIKSKERKGRRGKEREVGGRGGREKEKRGKEGRVGEGKRREGDERKQEGERGKGSERKGERRKEGVGGRGVSTSGLGVVLHVISVFAHHPNKYYITNTIPTNMSYRRLPPGKIEHDIITLSGTHSNSRLQLFSHSRTFKCDSLIFNVFYTAVNVFS